MFDIFLKGFWRRDTTIFFNYLISLFAKKLSRGTSIYIYSRILHHWTVSVSVSDVCWALPGGGSSCNLSEEQMILFCCFVVYGSQLLFFSVFTVLKHCYVYVLFSASVFTLSFCEPLLQCVCSLGSEETWTRREREREKGGQSHEEERFISF